MTVDTNIRETIAVYEKHGWVLRRVLFSAGSEKPAYTFAGDVSVIVSDIDAAWFSRPPKPGGVPWEIRYLGPKQYALVENIDETSLQFEDVLRDVENRLKTAVAAKQ